MKKGKSAKRKPKRLKMGTISCLLVIFLLTSIELATGANIPGEKGDQNSADKSDTGIRNQTFEVGVKDSRGLFSPRMDYDQWKPLGRGDPLQNDPTYDYVPPVLERVHYWIEPPTKKQEASTQPEGKKSEILVLGVSSKKPSTSPSSAENRRDSYESFLQFIDGPKFYHHNHNSYIRPNSVPRPSQGNPFNFHSQFFKNKFDDGHYKPDEQRMPYTVLVPPPIPSPHVEMPLFESPPPQPLQTTTPRPVYTPPSTSATPQSTVSVQEANLIYHSSSAANNNQWQNGGNQFATHGAGSQFISWRAPTDSPSNHINFQESETKNRIVFQKNSTESNIHVSQKRPFHPPLVFPTETGRIVFEQHSSFDPSMPVMPSQPVLTSDSILGPTPLESSPTGSPTLHVLRVAGSQPTVTQMSVGNQPMHKGQVSDDTIGNTYVNIGKPNAHIQQEITTDIPFIGNMEGLPTENHFKVPSSNIIKKPHMQMPISPSSYTSNQINSVYLSSSKGHMHKPIVFSNGQPFSRRPSPITDDYTMQTMQTMQPPPPLLTTERTKITSKKPSGVLQFLLQKESSTESTMYSPSTSYTPAPTTTPTPTTTAVTSLTTDPLFKHYKQPAEPLRGPMYLIIQGHSKVKTYGPTNKEILRDFSMPENNEIPKVDKYPVKHLHGLKDLLSDSKEDNSHSRSKNSRTLKDLVSEGIGSLDVQETELGVGYEVSDDKTMTSSEKYYKGIVESDENEMAELQKLKKIAKIREKRQLEEFIPVVEDTVETYIYDYLKRQSEGSGVGAFLASAITNDSSEDDDLNELTEDDDDEDEDI